MSRVTNVPLLTALGEETAIAEVNKAHDQLPFVEVSLPYAGSKYLECGVYVGAFNKLELERLVGGINKAPWRDREQTQFLIKEEDSERFVERSLFP